MIRNFALNSLLIALVVVTLTEVTFARFWTHRDGRHVEAEFIACENDVVRIRRTSDGRVFEVRLEILSDADRQFAIASAKPVESPPLSRWTQQLVRGLDQRTLAEKRRARMEDENGFAEAIVAWSKGLETIRKEKPSMVELLQLLVHYRSIWADDKHNAQATQERVARLKYLPRDAINAWKKALELTLPRPVSELQTIATMVDLPELFTANGFNQAQSQLLLGRLESLPRAHAEELSELIAESPLAAALLLVRNEEFFDQSQPRSEALANSLAQLRAYERSSQLSAQLANPAPMATSRPSGE